MKLLCNIFPSPLRKTCTPVHLLQKISQFRLVRVQVGSIVRATWQDIQALTRSRHEWECTNCMAHESNTWVHSPVDDGLSKKMFISDTVQCNTFSLRSFMMYGRNRLNTYEALENLKPGMISSVTAAPPTTCRLSTTATDRPDRCKYPAATNPLCPGFLEKLFLKI